MSKRGKAFDYGSELENLYKRWEHFYEHGGSDPSWSDGTNLSLLRTQIINCKRKIEKENTIFLLPDAYYRKIPPEVPRDYIARPDEIRENARKSMAIIDADKNLKFVREQSKSLSEKELKRLCIPAIIGYAENIRRAVAEDDLLTMRRYDNPERYLDSFRSAAERIRSLQFSENVNERLFDYEAEDEEEFEDMAEEEFDETEQENIEEILS
ncbi:MAG TPA: hypothetical protein DDX91_01125 [Ruminococcaceae bacterium]|nr:hypothetical protein [Oscillospiraceae bacterium]